MKELTFLTKIVSQIYENAAETEQGLGYSYTNMANNAEATLNFVQSISYAKLVVLGEKSAQLLVYSLIGKGNQLFFLSRNEEAKEVVSEAYNLAAIQHNPIHPTVFETSNFLIRILMSLKEFYD